MEHIPSDAQFSGAIPALYERHLVPMLFQPYADDLAARVAGLPARAVLEVAAGTGVVTRQLAMRLPKATTIVATDLNAAMLEQAKRMGTSRPVQWQPADAQQLAFADASFDVVACQFGVMFFPDKPRAFAEVRRVLRPGGTFLFNTWDCIEQNVFAQEVTDALADVFPDSPPRFLARTPYGYFDREAIARDLAAGGFTHPPRIDTLSSTSHADLPSGPAIAFCQGTPVRNEIESRDAAKLEHATHVVERALARRFGNGPIAGRMQALVVQVSA